MKFILITTGLLFTTLSYAGAGDGTGQPSEEKTQGDHPGVIQCVADTVINSSESLSAVDIAEVVAKCLSDQSSTEGVGDGTGNQGS